MPIDLELISRPKYFRFLRKMSTDVVTRLISKKCSFFEKSKREIFDHIPSISEVCERFKKNQKDGFRVFFIGYSDYKLKVYPLTQETKTIFSEIFTTHAKKFSTLILSDCEDSEIQELKWRCGTITKNGLERWFSAIYPDGDFIIKKQLEDLRTQNKTLILGCGNCPTGLGHDYMMRHQHKGCDTIDCSENMNPTFILDIKKEKIPCPDGVYDTIIAEGLSFILDSSLLDMMVELRRCLSPSGYIDFKFRRPGTYRDASGEWVHPDGKDCRVDFDTAFLMLSRGI